MVSGCQSPFFINKENFSLHFPIFTSLIKYSRMAGQKLTLQQKLLQKLSPQQIQMIKLLECLHAIRTTHQKELEENLSSRSTTHAT
jgi:hypothetical protein